MAQSRLMVPMVRFMVAVALAAASGLSLKAVLAPRKSVPTAEVVMVVVVAAELPSTIQAQVTLEQPRLRVAAAVARMGR